MSLKMTTSFHSTVDANVRALQAYNPRTGWGSILASLYTTYNFNLSYQFYPHFHPYVLQLARTLAETDSVYDLLAMNVEYQANPDGSLEAIPNSTRASVGDGSRRRPTAGRESEASARGRPADDSGLEYSARDHRSGSGVVQ